MVRCPRRIPIALLAALALAGEAGCGRRDDACRRARGDAAEAWRGLALTARERRADLTHTGSAKGLVAVALTSAGRVAVHWEAQRDWARVTRAGIAEGRLRPEDYCNARLEAEPSHPNYEDGNLLARLAESATGRGLPTNDYGVSRTALTTASDKALLARIALGGARGRASCEAALVEYAKVSQAAVDAAGQVKTTIEVLGKNLDRIEALADPLEALSRQASMLAEGHDGDGARPGPVEVRTAEEAASRAGLGGHQDLLSARQAEAAAAQACR
jgi:hypothetical protein